ncbi:MAG: TlpA family protein disulfide reductase [Planctomycetia bacterium]
MRTLVTAVVLVSLFASPTAGQPPERVVNIAMEDQFKHRHETGMLRGDVVVLVYAERKGGEAAQELGRRLHLHFHPTAATAPATEWCRQPVIGLAGWPAGVRLPDVHVVAVASLPEIPKALQPVARAQLRKDSPFVPVWLDFEGRLEHAYGIVPGAPNVVLVNPRGEVHAVLSGRVDDVKMRELVATIDALRLQARPEQRTAAIPTGLTR